MIMAVHDVPSPYGRAAPRSRVNRRSQPWRYTHYADRVAAASSSAGNEHPAYEQARDELTELVKRLEAGGLTLEQSLQLWERAEELAAICEEWLEGARARLATALAKQEPAQPAPGAPF
jgi:exodeoxyribonuclease VII small subunit